MSMRFTKTMEVMLKTCRVFDFLIYFRRLASSTGVKIDCRLICRRFII